MLIGEIVKNASERLRITVENYKGNTFVDVRVYYLDTTETWKPTRKGVALKTETVDDVLRLLTEAMTYTERKN